MNIYSNYFFVKWNKKNSYLRKFKKVQGKNSWNQIIINQKFFREIAFLVVLNFFQVQKLTFGHFLNGKIWNLVKKIIRKIDLFDFMSFFGLDFFKILWPTMRFIRYFDVVVVPNAYWVRWAGPSRCVTLNLQ